MSRFAIKECDDFPDPPEVECLHGLLEFECVYCENEALRKENTLLANDVKRKLELYRESEGNAFRLSERVAELERENERLKLLNRPDAWKDVPDIHDFMCVCNAKSKQLCDELMERVSKVFPDSSKLLSGIVYGLNDLDYGYYAGIDAIGCDMWALISAHLMRWNKDTTRYEPVAVFSVKCDELEHGLARVWELAHETAEKDRQALAGGKE